MNIRKARNCGASATCFSVAVVALLQLLAVCSPASAQNLEMSTCNSGASNPPACNPANVPGDRTEGWLRQSRSEVMARNGMVTTSQPLATAVGLHILRMGGNAVDAAVAAAATLNVVYPMNTGVGADLFAMIYIAKQHKLYVLNASGTNPAGESLAFMHANGYVYDPHNWGPGSGMPRHGILTVPVPGTVWGWQEVLDRFGTMTFKQVLQPAIDYATDGFPVSERIATEWQLPMAENAPGNALPKCCTRLDPDSVAAYYIDGKPPRAGQIYRNPDLARTFKLLQKYGRDVFYKGQIARAIVAKSRKLGGTLTMADMAKYHGEWVTPVSTDYEGFRLYELPPPSQGFAADEMLNILQSCTGVVYPGETLARLTPQDPRYWHMLIEAKRLAYADLFAYNGDPHFNPHLLNLVKSKLLTRSYAQSLCRKINPTHASATAPGGNASGNGDTIVLSTADRWGNMVAWVNSDYFPFGSGITVPGYGFILENRNALFNLNPASPNVIAPNKRPFNTLCAGFVMQEGKPNGQRMTLLLMGGDMQAQGHAQIMVNIVDLGANMQAATDLAHFSDNQVRGTVSLESQLYNMPIETSTLGAVLSGTYGYKVRSTNGGPMGGYQGILFTPDPLEQPPGAGDHTRPVNGFYRAGSDDRKDGEAIGW